MVLMIIALTILVSFFSGFPLNGKSGLWHKNGLRVPGQLATPVQAAFSDECIDEARLYMGEWAAAFGRQEATHSGEFLGYDH